MSNTSYAYEQPGNYARGWHVVLFSNELAIGEIKSLRYFERDLIVFRGENGEVAALDAYCPHLGAHLGGTGSKVIGNTVRCAFHGWQYDKSGACTHIPFASKIPERAKNALDAWIVTEKCGFIAVWHDQEGGLPDYELPDIPNWGKDAWGDWAFKRSRIPTQGKEIIENIVDKAHFAFVHGGVPEKFDITFDKHKVTQDSRIVTNGENVKIIPESAPDWLKERMSTSEGGVSAGKATYYGPAVMYYYSEMTMYDVSFKTWWLNFHVPVNDKEVDLCSGVIIAPLGDEPIPDEYRLMYPEIAHAAFGQDVEIWKSKKYQVDPILCDADGPVNKLRKWYDQFYQKKIIASS
jgi:3-ketosteroid 9alpha-monooxygenase subunit A